MAVLLATLLLFSGSFSSGARADQALRDTALRDTALRDTVVRDTVARLSARPVGIARPDTVLPFPDVTVRGRALEEAIANPRRLTRLTADEIEASGAASVAELLEARTGLFVKRYGPGGLATLSGRGASSQQTAVLIDGMRAADPQTGQVDLSLLPTIILRSAEVVHGAAGARYGSGALGGAVRFQTLRPARELQVDISGTVGAWDRRRGGLVARGGTGSVTGLLAAEGSRAEGNFPYENAALKGTPKVRRQGADRQATTLFGKARYTRSRNVLAVTGWYAGTERGLPGTVGATSSRARQWDRHLRLAARYTRRLAGEGGPITATARLQRTRRRYAGPTATDTARTARYALAVRTETTLGSRWTVAGGVEGAYERAALRGGTSRGRTAAFGHATAQWERLHLRPALRLDTYFSEEEARRTVAFSPSLGASVQPFGSETFRLKGRVARSFRAPTLGERFYQPGGNPDLRPEQGVSAEGGAAFAASGEGWSARAEATGFYTGLRDQIVWKPTIVAPGVSGWRPLNVDRVRTRGLEVSAEGGYRLGPALRLDGRAVYTRTEAEDRSDPATRAHGRQLPYVPPSKLKGHAGIAWRLPGGAGTLRMRLSGRLTARRYVTPDESQSVSPYQVFNARLRYARNIGGARATLGFAVENLTDEDYQIIRLYPMPPRHASLRFTLKTAP
jgi:iron complex outermembrane receptor protein